MKNVVDAVVLTYSEFFEVISEVILNLVKLMWKFWEKFYIVGKITKNIMSYKSLKILLNSFLNRKDLWYKNEIVILKLC